MSASTKSEISPEGTLAVVVLTAVILAGLGLVGAAELAHLTGAGAPPPANPATLVLHLVEGSYRWTRLATTWAVVEGLVLTATGVLVGVRIHRWNAGADHIDRRARRLAQDGGGLARYTDPSAAPVAVEAGPGPQIGRVIR